MHDFVVDFQFGQIHHIYRGLGKSRIRLVFCAIPYSRTSEIGAIDHDFETENHVLGEMCHPRVLKMTIFSDFSGFLAKTVKK